MVGSLFSGTYTIDPDDLIGSFPLFDGIFHDLSPAGSVSVTVQALPFSDAIEAVFAGDTASVPGHPLGSDVWLTASFEGVDPIYLSVAFSDSTGLQLASDAFFVNQSLAGWDSASFNIVRTSDNAVLASGSITSVTVVPEPATAALVAAGAALLAAWRRRRVLPAS